MIYGTYSAISNILSTMIISVYNFIYRPDNIADVLMEFNYYLQELFNKNWFKTIFASVQIVGIGLLTAACIVELVDKASSGDFSINMLFRGMLKYIIWYIVLINSITIFTYLIDMTTAVFDTMNNDITAAIVGEQGAEIKQSYLANTIEQDVGTGEKFGLFIMIGPAYIVSIIFYIILYFFSISRLIEVTIRALFAPIAAGVSFFGTGANSDFIRYVKRTMGIIFQIVVILVISAAMTLTHNSLVAQDVNEGESTSEIINPANNLISKTIAESPETIVDTISQQKTANDYNNSNLSGNANEKALYEVVSEDTVKLIPKSVIDKYLENGDSEKLAEEIAEIVKRYDLQNVNTFINSLVDPKSYALTTGLMLAALMLLFKSRQISSQLFE